MSESTQNINTTTIFCQKLKQDLPALVRAPLPGEIGERILAHISQQAWKEWLGYQTMLINENRLSLADARARQYLRTQMEIFLFGDVDQVAPVSGFVAPRQ